MPKARTIAEENRQKSTDKEAAKVAARAAYWEEQKKPKDGRKPLTHIARDHGIAASVLHALVNGRPTIGESNAEKQLLTPAEEAAIETYLIGMAKRGFPLTPRMVIEKAVRVLEAKTGEAVEVGKHWFSRFMERHPKLATYRAGPLDQIRANAANPVLLKDYADTVERLFSEHKPPPCNILGTDEVGINSGIAPRQTVVGKAGQRHQKQQQLGDRNNITVIETVCADGTVLRPIVIFKGQYLMLSWGDDNPDDAKVAVSAKGYTDNVLGVEALMFIDEQTKDREGARFLFVDGHGSHCTLEFLDYAAEHNIIVISYPPHLTQWLQGLDVACFGPLKIFWSQEKGKWEHRMRQRVSKETFLRVYSNARKRAFSESTILSAFRTTGIVPLRRDFLTLEASSPAKVQKINGKFPLALPTPAKAIIQAQKRVQDVPHGDATPTRGSSASSPSINFPPVSPLATRTPTAQIPLLRQVLAGTSAEFLVSDSPLKSTSRLPPLVIQSNLKSLDPDWSILRNPVNVASMSRKQLEEEVERLRVELRRARDTVRRERAINEGANAQLVLRDVHLDELTGQLAAKEAKKENPLKNLMASKTARCMTDSGFRDVKREMKRQKEEAAKRKVDAEAERALVAEREKWRDAEKIERAALQKAAILKWQEEAKEAKRLKKKQPKRPAVTKIYPRAPTPDHLKPRKQREAIAANIREKEGQEEIDIEVIEDAGSDTDYESDESE